jgi:AAA domain-containing protein
MNNERPPKDPMTPGDHGTHTVKYHPARSPKTNGAAPVVSLQTRARLDGGGEVTNAAKKAWRIKTTFSCDFGARSAKTWVLKRLIALGEIISIVGAPFAGKSGLIAAMVIAIAHGVDFRGFGIKSAGAVIIFAIERGGLVQRRVEAQCLRDGIECGSLPIAVCAGSLDILDSDCVEIIKLKIAETETKYDRKVVAIVIDTQNKAIAAGGGDEDRAKDQNRATANLRQLLADLDDRITIIQAKHSGKDPSRGSRGSNAQEGDDDVTINVKDRDGMKVVEVTGANDLPKGALLNFKMEPYRLGTDEDGDPIETWIASNETFEPEPQAKKKGLRAAQSIAFEALCNVCSLSAPASLNQLPGTQVATMEMWKAEVFRRGGDQGKNPHRDFDRRRESLQAAHLIAVDGQYVWPVFAGPKE